MADFNKPLDIMNYPRLSLFTPAPGVDKERAAFEVGTLNGMPRFTTWTRSDDKERGPIYASFGQEALMATIAQMHAILDAGVPDAFGADYLKTMGEGSYDKQLHSTLNFGRGDDGICYIGLKAADEARPKIMFYFRGFEWHPFRRKNKPFTPEELSTIHARAWLNLLKASILSNIKGQTPEERRELAERRKAMREARGGGGGGNRGYGQQQQQKPQKSFTDTGSFGDDYSL